MKYNTFTFQNNKLLCWRLGGINAQRQVHYNRDIETVAGMGTHKPPVSRGVWAFPYPHYDFFFCFHQWVKRLPKKFQRENKETLTEQDWEEYELLIKKAKKIFRPSKFYSGEFYSHVFPNGSTDYNSWFYWDSARDWAKVAKKTLVEFYKTDQELLRMEYSKDHLEIFVPNP